MRYFLVLVLTLLFFTTKLTAQQTGCTDPRATNFNPVATSNDGSCRYPTTTHHPTFLFELPYETRESSGLLLFDDLLWTHNDSKHKPELYALSPLNGHPLKKVRVSNVVNVDWEELAMDDQYIYIGDFGNNDGQRRLFQIYKVALSELAGGGDKAVIADTISFFHKDQPEKAAYLNHNYDHEAMVAAGDSLYLFSKNWADGRCTLYRLPKQKGVWQAEAVDNFDTKGLITGADYQPETGQLVLVGYTQKTWMPFLWILSDFQGYRFFSGNKRRINLARMVTKQVEAVAFAGTDKVLITTEKSKTASARVFSINTFNWVSGNEPLQAVDSELCRRSLEFDPIADGYQLFFLAKQSKPFVVELLDVDNQGFFYKIFEPEKPQQTFFIHTDKDFNRPGTLVIKTHKTTLRCKIP